MSKKHFDEYFNSVVNDYKEMVDTIHELELECSQGLVDPDRVEQMKALVEPIKQNYMTLSWVMFLLNKPNKKKKEKKYNKMLINKIDLIDPNKERSPEAIKEMNKNYIKTLKNVY